MAQAAHDPQGAADGLADLLGARTLGAHLGRLFGERLGSDGNPFTPVHASLVRLPLRGLVTTNYDPCLLEARRALRPDVRETGYLTWQDSDPLYRWYTGVAFGAGLLPVLYSHGAWERPGELVLGGGSYRTAYRRQGIFGQVVNRLWSQEHLLLVGVGLRDPWLERFVDEIPDATVRQASVLPRHVALVGLPDGERYTPRLRRDVAERYDAEVLFYPVTERVQDGGGVRQDHRALGDLLAWLVQDLVDGGARAAAGSPSWHPGGAGPFGAGSTAGDRPSTAGDSPGRSLGEVVAGDGAVRPVLAGGAALATRLAGRALRRVTGAVRQRVRKPVDMPPEEALGRTGGPGAGDAWWHQAQGDATDALRLAQECGGAWAELASHAVLAELARAVEDRAQARSRERRVAELGVRLWPSGRPDR